MDESPSLINYIFTSDNVEKMLEHQQWPDKYNMNWSSTGLLTYGASPVIGRNTYGYGRNKPFQFLQAPGVGKAFPRAEVRQRG